jgi:hypothetical protein
MQYCQQPAAEMKSAWLLTQSTDAACSHSSSSQPASGGAALTLQMLAFNFGTLWGPVC